jgi:hypothetical protein
MAYVRNDGFVPRAHGNVDGGARVSSFNERITEIASEMFDFMKHWGGLVTLGMGGVLVVTEVSTFLVITGLALMALSFPLIAINYCYQEYDQLKVEMRRLRNIINAVNTSDERLEDRINGRDTDTDNLPVRPFNQQIADDIGGLRRKLVKVNEGKILHNVEAKLDQASIQINSMSPDYAIIKNLYLNIADQIQLRQRAVGILISRGVFAPARDFFCPCC